jgi:hypothetical protein
MIRPEAKAHLWRWREVIAGGGTALLGLWWVAGAGGVLLLPGAVLSVGGAAMVWIGLQRARFRAEGQGPGSVDVDEGEITYFGPLTGGSVALRDLAGITLDPTSHPPHWRLRQAGRPELAIPVNAAGADLLFDAFATLPGFRMERALQALKAAREHPIVIWRSDVPIPVPGSAH